MRSAGSKYEGSSLLGAVPDNCTVVLEDERGAAYELADDCEPFGLESWIWIGNVWLPIPAATLPFVSLSGRC